MCGLVGVAGKLEYKDEEIFKRLLLYDYFRGPDSTGMAAIDVAGTRASVVKIASHPIDLFDLGRFKTSLSAQQSSVFMGHNRAATKGAVNGVNAHPYEYGHIVGCHNGTLTSHAFTELENALGERFDVDSQAVFAAISRLGIDRTVSLLQGAWSLVWFDLREKTLNFLRNKERPLWYAYSETFNHFFWASEWPTIHDAVRSVAHGPALYKDPDGYRFWSTPEDIHMQFKIADLRAGSQQAPAPILRQLKGKEPARVVTGGQDPFGRQGPANAPGGITSTKKSPKNETNLIQLFGNKSAPFAGFISYEKFCEIAKYGCSWCGADVIFEEVGVTVFEQDGTVLCPVCSGSKQNKVYTTTLDDKLSARK